MGDLSNEPSMEDILASIKKIISEDSDTKVSPPMPRESFKKDQASEETAVEPQVVDAAPEADDILELSAPDEAAPETVADTAPVSARFAVAPSANIVSPDAAAASRSALASLSHMLVKPETVGSDTLEGLVREMLKPLLKQWLDDHLPEVVEKIVAQEVARISGRSF